MSKQRFSVAPVSTRSRTILRDLDGSTVLEVGYADYLIVQPDGSTLQERVSDSVPLVCGTLWNPGMLMAQPPCLVALCQDCRHPPRRGFRRERATHGVVALHNAVRCSACGKLLCPKHARPCRDGAHRCSACTRAHSLYRVLASIKSIFWIPDDE